MHGILFHVCLMTGYRQYANRQPKLHSTRWSILLDSIFLLCWMILFCMQYSHFQFWQFSVALSHFGFAAESQTLPLQVTWFFLCHFSSYFSCLSFCLWFSSLVSDDIVLFAFGSICNWRPFIWMVVWLEREFPMKCITKALGWFAWFRGNMSKTVRMVEQHNDKFIVNLFILCLNWVDVRCLLFLSFKLWMLLFYCCVSICWFAIKKKLWKSMWWTMQLSRIISPNMLDINRWRLIDDGTVCIVSIVRHRITVTVALKCTWSNASIAQQHCAQNLTINVF